MEKRKIRFFQDESDQTLHTIAVETQKSIEIEMGKRRVMAFNLIPTFYVRQ